MTPVRFRKHIGAEERRVYVHAVVKGEEIPGRGTRTVVEFDRVRDCKTGDNVSAHWLEKHVKQLSKAAVYAAKDKIHRDRVPVGA